MRSCLILCGLLGLIGAGTASADLREDLDDAKFICPTDPGEIWLWFSFDAKQVFRKWSQAEFIDLEWIGERVAIGGKYDQDGPFYFERTKSGYSYGGFPCRRVGKLPIDRLKKKDLVK